MTLETLYLVSQIAGAVVIILTLFAILWQARQTNRIARAELALGSWTQTGQVRYAQVDSPEKIEFLHRALLGDAPLTEPEKLRFACICECMIGKCCAAFNLRSRSLVEGSAYERLGGVVRWRLSGRRVRKWRRAVRSQGFSPEFRHTIDALVEAIEIRAAALTNEEHAA